MKRREATKKPCLSNRKIKKATRTSKLCTQQWLELDKKKTRTLLHYACRVLIALLLYTFFQNKKSWEGLKSIFILCWTTNRKMEEETVGCWDADLRITLKISMAEKEARELPTTAHVTRSSIKTTLAKTGEMNISRRWFINFIRESTRNDRPWERSRVFFTYRSECWIIQ